MGAEPDSSPPPPPEPTLSPKPEIPGHDNRNWNADMMSALGESVSFGRFLSEPLEWGKWSAFAHNRYLEEAARQSRPGSVAQRKAFFEAHYARKRKSEADDAPDYGEGGDVEDPDGGGGDLEAAYGGAVLSSVTESSCMTDGAPGEEMCGGGGDADAADCGGDVGDAPPVVVSEEVEAITDAVSPSCRMDEASDKLCHKEGGKHVSGAIDGLQSLENKDLRNENLVAVDAVEKQPLKESSIVNQDITDSAKKRRLQMSPLLQKPTKSSSRSSGKKGQSSSVKRRSLLHWAKENTSPPSTDNSKEAVTSVPKERSALAALHMSMSFTRSETGNAASSSRNLGTTIAERISQLQSASRPVENTQPEEFMPPKKTFSRALTEIAPRMSKVDEQRSSHVMRVKEKLFGSISPSVHQKTGITNEKEIERKQNRNYSASHNIFRASIMQKKLNNNPGFKESRQGFCFKARPLPNFYRKSKQVKDSSEQTAQEIQHWTNTDHLLSDVNHVHKTSKDVSKEKQICCFPIRKLY